MAAAVEPSAKYPVTPFVEDVEEFLAKSGTDANGALVSLQDRYQQYKLTEMKLLARRRDLQTKLPEIKKCLDIVETLMSRKAVGEGPLVVDFELVEKIYSQARIDEGNTVCLWLGANVMLEYSYDEALVILKKNLNDAKSSLDIVTEDLKFIRDQIIVTEVTLARVFNWDVHNRRKQKQREEKEGE